MKELIFTELKLLYRRKQELVNPLLFFVLVCSLFPLAVSPEPETLERIAPGILWVAATLASMLSLDMLFRHDYDDGSLEQLTFGDQPLYMLMLVKIACYWLMSGLPLVLISPLLGLMLFLPSDAMPIMVLSLLLGTPILAMLGSIGAALTVSLRRGGVIVALLVLPLFMPVIIFGSSAVVAAAQGLPATGQLLWLAALAVAGVCLAPLATAIAVRIAVACD